jgi:hypothetical protein
MDGMIVRVGGGFELASSWFLSLAAPQLLRIYDNQPLCAAMSSSQSWGGRSTWVRPAVCAKLVVTLEQCLPVTIYAPSGWLEQCVPVSASSFRPASQRSASGLASA